MDQRIVPRRRKSPAARPSYAVRSIQSCVRFRRAASPAPRNRPQRPPYASRFRGFRWPRDRSGTPGPAAERTRAYAFRPPRCGSERKAAGRRASDRPRPARRGAERTRDPAPNEANPRHQTKPIPGAKRSQSPRQTKPIPAPSEANPSRRANPIPGSERTRRPHRADLGRAPSGPGGRRARTRRSPPFLLVGPMQAPIRGRGPAIESADDRIIKDHPLSSQIEAAAFLPIRARVLPRPRAARGERPGPGRTGTPGDVLIPESRGTIVPSPWDRATTGRRYTGVPSGTERAGLSERRKIDAQARGTPARARVGAG